MAARALHESPHEKACPIPVKPVAESSSPMHERVGLAVKWVKAILCGMNKARTIGLAAEMSFWLFLSLIPLAAVAGLVAARLAFAHFDVVGPMLASAPPEVSAMITEQMGKVAAWNGGAVAPVASLMFVWLAASGVHSVFDALEVQTGTSRPWWKKRLLAIGSCVGLSMGLAALALVMTGVGWIRRLASNELHSVASAGGSDNMMLVALRLFVAAGIVFALVAGLYWVGLPKSARQRMPIVPGAGLAVLLQFVMGWGYSVFIAKTGTGDAYQAGLAVMGITLMTLFLFSLSLLVGAEVNQAIGETRILKLRQKRHTRAEQRDDSASAVA